MEQTQYDVFISYSRHDYVDEHENVIPNNEVSKIMKALTDAGITYWIDKEGIYSGDKFTEELPRIIKSVPIFVYLSTANSNQSKYTSKEIAIADEYGKYIIPVRIDMTPYSDNVIFRIADVSFIKYAVNPEKGREDLVKSIKAFLNKEDVKVSTLSPTHTLPILKLKADVDCVFFLDGKETAKLKAGKLSKFPLSEGEYELRFVSVENDKDFMVEDNFKMPLCDKRFNVNLLPVRDKRLEQERMAEEERQKAWERAMNEVKEEAKRLEGAKADYEVFSYIGHFAQGYALVQYKETQCWHFLDKNGRLSQEGYQNAGCFSSDGFAAVEKNGLWGFVDREFNCKTGFVYSRVGGFSEGLAYFEQDVSEGDVKVRRGFLDTSFSVALDLTKNYSAYGLQFDNYFKCGLFKIWSYCHSEWIDHSGRIVAKFDEMYKQFSNFSRMQVGDIINGAVGVVVHHWIDPSNCQSDEMQFLIQEQRFVKAFGNFSEDGYALNRLFHGYNMEEDYDGTVYSFRVFSKYGYVNKSGENVSEYKYSYAKTFSEHFAAVSLDGEKYGFIDNQFKPICDFVYDEVGYFSEGKAAVKQDGHWGFINTTGKLIIPCEYDRVDHFSEGMAPVQRAGKWGFVNPKGTLVIQCVFDEVEHFSENYCIVSINRIRFFVDKKGDVLQLIQYI